MANGIELAKAYVQIIPSAEGIKSKITEEMGGDISRAGDDLGKVFGGRIVGTLKKVLGAAAIGKTIAASINAGGALEQSLGGIETLFKDSAGIVQQNAAQAYKTAGLSANDYMEQTTSFAASLLSSLGNNTKAAAIVADMAMTDMADNANKMGTDMAAIQNAYQGFAKQNYTMLDNLKLGYGGTQAEMQRLLEDASKLSGQKYELGNLADMYNAIHVIQQELDITGTTAKEASTTLTGSFSAMSAAFKNVLGNLATGGELTSSLQALTETARTYLLDNLLPAVGNVVAGIPQVIATLAPNILQSGTELMQSLASGFTEGIPAFLASALPQVLQFTEELRANFGQFVSAGVDLILNLANGIVEGLPQLFAYIPDIVINIAGLINDNAPKLLEGGFKLVVALGKGILQAASLIPQYFSEIMGAVVSVISAINWINIGTSIINGLANGIKSMASFVTDSFKQAVAGGLTWLKTLPSQLFNIAKNALQSFINGLTGKAVSFGISSAAVALTPSSKPKIPHITAADESIADKNEHNSMIMSNLSAANNAKALADAAKSSGTAAKAATTAAKKTAEDTKKLTSSLKDTTTEIVQGSGDIVGSIKRVTETANNLYDVYDGTTKKLKGTANETTKTITDTWTEIINGTEKTVKQVTTIAADGSKKVEKSVDNVTLSVTEMQSRIDKALSQAKNEWSDGIFGLFRGIVSDIKSKDWSGLALDFAKLLWGQVDQGQREIIAQWAANALSAVNDAYAGGGLSAAASSIKAIFSDGIAAGATEAGTAVQSFSTILEGLNASGGVGSALSGIASSFSGMASSVISSLSGIVSLVMGNPILAAILGVTALAGGIALGSFLKKKSSFATSVTGNSTAYKDLQEAFWPGDRRAAAGYDALSSPYGLSARASGAQVTTYQQKMQASVDALYNVVQQYLPQAGNQTIQLDNGVLVGALVPSIDTELGRRATRAGRGG